MKRKRHIIVFIIATLLLITAAGCGNGKELWEILENAQYNKYKPRLDHMVKKYGDMFMMDVYGTVTCTNPEYNAQGFEAVLQDTPGTKGQKVCLSGFGLLIKRLPVKSCDNNRLWALSSAFCLLWCGLPDKDLQW